MRAGPTPTHANGNNGPVELADFYRQHVYPGAGGTHSPSPTPRSSSSLRPLQRGREMASPQPGVPSLHRATSACVSVAVQAAPTQHQRFYFPHDQSAHGGFAGPILKYFDVTLPEPTSIGELPPPVAAAALPLLPGGVQRDWQRLQYSDDVDPAAAEAAAAEAEEAAAAEGRERRGFAAAPRFDRAANYWLEEHAPQLRDVAVFTQWVCRVKARTYTDERALSSLRVGLLAFLSEQTSTKAAQVCAYTEGSLAVRSSSKHMDPTHVGNG